MAKMALAAVLMMFAVQANADVYNVDPMTSTISWRAAKKISTKHYGKVSVKEGSVDVDTKNQVTSATVVADMSTIISEDLADSPDYAKKLVGHLSSPDFFDVAKYPTATFKLKAITKKGNENIASGDLTFVGKTNPVEFPVTFKVEKGVATGSGTLKLDRTRWGLKYGSGNIFKELTADKIISDEFELDFALTAKKSKLASSL